MNKKTYKIAVDGPSGAGKSTISRIVAGKLGFIYVDTGALYRAAALYVLKTGIHTADEASIVACLDSLKVTLAFSGGVQHVFLNGEDVSQKIRTPEVSMAASAVSAVPEVRKFLFNLQRTLADENNCIMDGRDIGTVVLPDAQIKIFLTASAEDRAKRRYDELVAKGVDVKYEDVLKDVNARDYNDSHREIAPLKPSEDSIMVDTTGNTLEQSVEMIISVIKEKLNDC